MPIGFGAPGLPETFLRNGEGRRTQTAEQRKGAALHGKDATALAAIVENSGMRSKKALLHGEMTSSIIDSFFEVRRVQLALPLRFRRPFTTVARPCCLCDGHLVVNS